MMSLLMFLGLSFSPAHAATIPTVLTAFQSESALHIKGVKIDAVSNSTTSVDVSFSSTTFAKGAIVKWTGANFGDSCEFTLLMPDGQGGYIEVGKYAETVHLLGDGDFMVETQYVKEVPAGLVYRATYYNTGQSNAKMTVNYILETQ